MKAKDAFIIFFLGVLVGALVVWFFFRNKDNTIIRTVTKMDTVQIQFYDTVVVHDTLLQKDSVFVTKVLNDTVVIVVRDSVIRMIDTVKCDLGKTDVSLAEYYLQNDQLRKRIVKGGVSFPLFSSSTVRKDGTAIISSNLHFYPSLGLWFNSNTVGGFGGISILRKDEIWTLYGGSSYPSTKSNLLMIGVMYQRFIRW